jgi:hypothetical protein
MARRFLYFFAALGLVACTSESPERAVPVAATAQAIDARTVEIDFTETLEAESVAVEAMQILAPYARPIEELAIESVEVTSSLLTVHTAEQRGGRAYTLALGALKFSGIEVADYSTQINFRGFGRTQVSIVLDTSGFVVPDAVNALVTVDPNNGEYSQEVRSVPMMREAGTDIFRSTLSVRIDPDKIFAARAVTGDGREAGKLTTFTVSSTAAVEVSLGSDLPLVPEFEPPVDPVPGDGFAPVRVILDDRFALELEAPQIRSSLDSMGRFDISVSRLDTPSRIVEKGRVYEATFNVAVDPNRGIGGTTAENFPYVLFLVEKGEDLAQRGATFEMKTEQPQLIIIPMGNPALVPVRFRVDAGSAFLEPDGALRGVYPGEGVFLTGEFPSAEDALGRLAADAFTGGERASLQMKERPDARGIYEKTIFMPPNRPYGWKVVRCPAGQGCAELNRHVLSSGRAFPTVMKNLVTANVDAAQSSAVKLIDPKNLDRVELEGGQIADYRQAQVSESGMEAPSPMVMFKQEAPDLVVTVGTVPVTTPTYIVGSWRDVNIPETPLEIIANGGSIDLAPYDYDDGTQGRFPLIRDIQLPDDPGAPQREPGDPAFVATDGRVDTTARRVAGDGGRLPLFVGWNEREIYVATDEAAAGRDHFILLSLERPNSLRATHWAKGGTEAAGNRQVFLAMEGDGEFQGWFQRGSTGTNDTELTGGGVRSSQGSALEGTFDPARVGLGAASTHIWVAVVSFGTSDGGALMSGTQTPAGNGDSTVDISEFLEIELSTVRSQ